MKDTLKIKFKEMIGFLENYVGRMKITEVDDFLKKKIPVPLLWFYQYVEERIDDVIIYNQFVPSSKLNFNNRILVFYIYEGDTCRWGVENGKDKNVVKINEDKNITYEENNLVDFLFQICIYEVCHSLDFNLMFFGRHEEVDKIKEKWSKFPFVDRKTEDDFPNEFYHKTGAIGFVWRGKKGSTFYCGAKNTQNLEFMKEFTFSKGLKNDDIYTDPKIRLEKGYWDFYRDGESCKEGEFWGSSGEQN